MTTNSILPPFASSSHYERIALRAIKGEGAYLIDEDGRRCFDGISGMRNVPLGYTVPQLQAALARIHQIAHSASQSLPRAPWPPRSIQGKMLIAISESRRPRRNLRIVHSAAAAAAQSC